MRYVCYSQGMTTPEAIAAKLSPSMIGALMGPGDASPYGNATVLGNTNTVVALMDRGLVNGGRAHYWTPLGREVARAYLGPEKVRSMDELHAEALAEDSERYPVKDDAGLPDPNATGPCELQSSPFCTGQGAQRTNPMDMLDRETAFRDFVFACLPCYETNADRFVVQVHGR